ncbi:MAG: AAA family ATPase [Proteobacteria bacterium]|nr:AAA family ATPase [Pseudomonadota bacterium]
MANPDIASWLADLGLNEYVQVFADNRIDFDVLPDLGEVDLRELGLALGDRKRLLKAIEGLDQAPVAQVAAVREGERRQVAVLFADISGFTRLTAERDAEDIHQLLNRFFAAVDGAVQSFGGTIDKHIGDAVMAVFGAPVAHTDDPERAVRAALAVHEAAARLDPPIRVHAGVAAGQVVASSTGSAAHREYTVTGDTVNLASRLTDLATVGQTLIPDAVHDILGAGLDAENLGAQTLPGIPYPVGVWRVKELAGARTFSQGQFVGRKVEIDLFEAALDATVRNGRGQTLVIRGEAGIGKTRLMQEFQRLAEARGFHSHGGQILDFGVGEGQDAIRVMVRSLLELAPGADHNLRAGAAEKIAASGLLAHDERLHLNDLLNLTQTEAQRAEYEAMGNQQRNRGRVETLVSLVAGLSAQAPLLLRLEDLHWATPAMLEFLTGLVTAADKHPVILLLTSRVQGDILDATWLAGIGAAAFHVMDLRPLSAAEAHDLVFDFEGVDGARAAACIERSGGNPLFLEQLLRSPGGGDGQAIPGSVQSVVQARIDGLSGEDRTALQAASVLGQHFTLDAVRHVAGDADYQPANLLQNDLIRKTDAGYQFYHALFRDAVHSSFLKGRRQALHLRAAAWFQDRDAVLYAEHLGQADSDKAPLAFQQAARAEAGAYRVDRALELVERGLALLAADADRYDLTAHRADLLRELGHPADGVEAWEEALTFAETDRQRCLAWIGIAAAERLMGLGERGLRVLDQAEAVARRLGLEKELAEIFYYRGSAAFFSAQIEECLELQQEALSHARLAGSHEWEAVALGGLADAEYARGRMRNAQDYFERCFALCRAHGLLHIEARNRFMTGVTRRYLGPQDVALGELAAAVELSDRIHDVRGGMMARNIQGEILMDMADFAAADTPLQEALSIARSLGNRRMELYELYQLSRHAHCQEQTTLAQERMDQAIENGRETGIHFHGPRLFALQALIAPGAAACRKALAAGAALVRAGANAHNVLWFHRDAIDACLAIGDHGRVRGHADALLAFTVAEPLPWATFFASRGHALADCADGLGNAAALAKVHGQGSQLGLAIALPAIEAAQAQLA